MIRYGALLTAELFCQVHVSAAVISLSAFIQCLKGVIKS